MTVANIPEAINSSFYVRTNFNEEPGLISDFKIEVSSTK